MSIKCMTRVWEKSKAKGSGLLLLLALADHADDNGFAFPGIPTLAHKIRMSERQTMRIIKQQEVAKELIVVRRPNKSNLYVVATDPKPQRLKDAAARVASFGGGDILSLCKNVMPVVTSEASGVTKCHAGGDIAVSPDPSLTIIEPSVKHQSGRDFLDDLFDHSLKKSKNNRPEGWSKVGADIWEICSAVAEGFPCDMPVVKPNYPSNTKEMARKKIDDWIGGAIFILEKFNSDLRSALGAIGAFRLEYDGGFTVAGPQSLLSNLSPDNDKPNRQKQVGVGQERRAPRRDTKRGRREYEPSTDAEREVAWDLYGDALLGFIEDRGTDANLGAITTAIANALGVDDRMAQAVQSAYTVRKMQAEPVFDPATFFDE